MQLIVTEAATSAKSDTECNQQIIELQGSAPDHASSQESEIPERLVCVWPASYSHTRTERKIELHLHHTPLGSA